MAAGRPVGSIDLCVNKYTDFDYEVKFFNSVAVENVVALVFSDPDSIGFCARLQRVGIDAVDRPTQAAGVVTVLNPTSLLTFDPQSHGITLVMININRWWRTIGGVAASFDKDDDMGSQPRDCPERMRAFQALLTHVCAVHVLCWQCGQSSLSELRGLQEMMGEDPDSGDQQEAKALEFLQLLCDRTQKKPEDGRPMSQQKDMTIGCQVRLVGLRRHELNGRVGRVVEKDSGVDSNRVGVSVTDGTKHLRMALKPQNLDLLVDFFASHESCKSGAKGLRYPHAEPPYVVEVEGDEGVFHVGGLEGVFPGRQRKDFDSLGDAIRFAELYGTCFDHDVPCMIWEAAGCLLFDHYTYRIKFEKEPVG